MIEDYKSLVINTPIGNLELVEHKNFLIRCCWTDKQQQNIITSKIIQETEKQIAEYFNRSRKSFNLPLFFDNGTKFQITVWEQLKNIPYGNTSSYQDIARAIDNDKAVRAVGTANSKNPFCIIIPCHRVVRLSGDLGGYAGGIDKKEFLLKHEK